MAGCVECTSGTTCIRCDTLANYMLSNGSCMAAPGYYLNSSSIAVKCNITGCYLCASATLCTTCSVANNYIMDNATQTCICDSFNNFVELPSALTCVCKPGYYLSGNGSCDLVPLCPANYSGCLNCSITPTTSCLQCDVANYFEVAAFSPLYCTCTNGTYFTGFACDFCNSTLTNACISCASQLLCI